MADSSAIDQALIALLGADVTLLSYMPNGVYWDEAPEGLTRFVIVSLVDETDVPLFQTRSHEDAVYAVEARGLSTASPNMPAAAARIDALLNDQTLTVAGYSHMLMQREHRIRRTERDGENPALRWQRRGGQYRIIQSL